MSKYGTNIIRDGRIIKQSKNLRAMVDYARVSPVLRIESCNIGPNKGQGTVRVIYANGAESRANFNSYHIMIDWIRKRRNWRGALHIMQGPNMGYLTRPGIIAGGAKC